MTRKHLINFSKHSFYSIIGMFILSIILPILSAVLSVLGTISIEDAITNMKNPQITPSALLFFIIIFIYLLNPLYIIDILFRLIRKEEVEIIGNIKQSRRKNSFYVYSVRRCGLCTRKSNKKYKLKFSRICTQNIGMHGIGSTFSNSVMVENAPIVGEKYIVSYLFNSKWCVSSVKIDYFSM